MTTGWNLQSCQCKIYFNRDESGNFIMESWKQKCPLHKDVGDEQLLDTLLTHDRQWNGKKSGNPTGNDEELAKLKSAENARIKKLGDVIKNANYRSRGRR